MTDETIEQAYFRGQHDGMMIKEMECQQRVKRIFKEIEDHDWSIICYEMTLFTTWFQEFKKQELLK